MDLNEQIAKTSPSNIGSGNLNEFNSNSNSSSCSNKFNEDNSFLNIVKNKLEEIKDDPENEKSKYISAKSLSQKSIKLTSSMSGIKNCDLSSISEPTTPKQTANNTPNYQKVNSLRVSHISDFEYDENIMAKKYSNIGIEDLPCDDFDIQNKKIKNNYIEKLKILHGKGQTGITDIISEKLLLEYLKKSFSSDENDDDKQSLSSFKSAASIGGIKIDTETRSIIY